MSVTTIDTTQSTYSALSSATSTATSGATLDELDFLTLLVAQLENQDPLNPQDSTEFASQLAEYSSLEQQTLTNEKLDSLLASSQSSEQAAAFNLLGTDVSVYADGFYYDGQPIDLGVNLAEEAASVSVEVFNSEGTSVATLALDGSAAGQQFVTWDGTDNYGNALAAGQYDFQVTAYDASGEAIENAPMVRARVTGVEPTSSGSLLITDGGTIAYNDIARASEAAS